MYIHPLNAIDFYKSDHRRQYPENTTHVYSNLTARTVRPEFAESPYYDGKIIFFGLQYFILDFLIHAWNDYFFKQPKTKVIAEYKRRMDFALGKNAIETQHIEKLHDLGYLPLKIKALPEGTCVPVGVPLLTITNTHPDFFWLTNYVETILLNYLWKPITSATTAFSYRRLLTDYAIKTGASKEFIPYQAHDFSFRGMSGFQDASSSGAAHLTAFVGTDTVPAIDFLENFYYADAEKELIGCSVAATEHSVMSMGMPDGELNLFKRLLCDVYPTGILSIVSDTWDLWKVVTEYVAHLKEIILKRDGKLVIRPDSGDPVKIITGDPNAPKNSPAHKGVLHCLWEVFGGSVTETGYKLLDPHIGVIFGDSITLLTAEKILSAMEKKQFCSGNIVFGVGSHSYQYVTRDTFGFAIKATSGVVNGERREIFKNPKTDSKVKKSAKGLLRVEKENGVIVFYDQQTEIQENQGLLHVVFENGKLIAPVTLQAIRDRVNSEIAR